MDCTHQTIATTRVCAVRGSAGGTSLRSPRGLRSRCWWYVRSTSRRPPSVGRLHRTYVASLQPRQRFLTRSGPYIGRHRSKHLWFVNIFRVHIVQDSGALKELVRAVAVGSNRGVLHLASPQCTLHLPPVYAEKICLLLHSDPACPLSLRFS